jgi:uncharacterized protein (DUF1330 family)
MPKGYWITTYHSISNPDALQKYAALAGPALTAAGGRFIARGLPAATFENAPMQRCVVIKFPSVAHAVAAYESPAYKEATAFLTPGAVEREIRIMEGAE